MHTASLGHPVTFFVDTDSRPGGCRESLRLRQVACGAEGQACCPIGVCEEGTGCTNNVCQPPVCNGQSCNAGDSCCNHANCTGADGFCQPGEADCACSPGEPPIS